MDHNVLQYFRETFDNIVPLTVKQKLNCFGILYDFLKKKKIDQTSLKFMSYVAFLFTADNLSNAKPAVQQRHPGD